MSKIGNKVIQITAPTSVKVEGAVVTVTGPNGTLTQTLPKSISVKIEGDVLTVSRSNETGDVKALHGLFRSLIANAVVGVSKLWEKRLAIVGTGFNVKQQGEDLVFKIGYSHTVTFKKQPGVKLVAESPTVVVVQGADKQLVGQVAYQIKKIRKPDPYKAKGIRYEGEVIKTKVGKKAKA